MSDLKYEWKELSLDLGHQWGMAMRILGLPEGTQGNAFKMDMPINAMMVNKAIVFLTDWAVSLGAPLREVRHSAPSVSPIVEKRMLAWNLTQRNDMKISHNDRQNGRARQI